MLIFLTAFFAVAALSSLALVLFRRPKADPAAQVLVREIPFTALLGLLLWLEAGVILYYGYTVPERLLVDQNSFFNTAIFLVFSIALGAVLLPYCFVKGIEAGPEAVVYTDALGRQKRLRWEEITTVSSSSGKRLTLQGGNVRFTVGGDRKQVKAFIAYAEGKIPRHAGDDVIRALKQGLKM